MGELLTTAQPPLGKDSSQVLYNSVQNNFVTSGVKRQITKTYYDTAAFSNILPYFTQNNLRPRVSSTTYQENDGNNYDRATHYDYDIEGNVQTLVHEISVNGNCLAKRVDYDYDLVSGKVNYVYYQRGEDDQFFHKYDYDADNRLLAVYTSRDSIIWEKDAGYQYYGHGPLARMVIGNNIDSIDYAYTIQEWIKGGRGNSFNYGLGYYSNGVNIDYKAINGKQNGLQATPINNSLFNGNIATMTSINSHDNSTLTQQFEYDLLNRIKKSSVLAAASASSYSTAYSYDANGNIKTLNRYDASGAIMDQLVYNYQNVANGYKKNTNKLAWVNDGVQTNIPTDIENQQRDNYGYDDIGQLNQDVEEGIANIDWNVYGKIKSVTRADTSEKPDLEFQYDASGNRIAKIVKNRTGDTTVTYYVRDAASNVLSIYEQIAKGSPIALAESHIYGNNRIGIANADIKSMVRSEGDTNIFYTNIIGLRDYEVKDHLGNVRVVLSDARTSTGSIGLLASYDYYPGGLLLKSFNNGLYRYGMNGQEKDEEVNGVQLER